MTGEWIRIVLNQLETERGGKQKYNYVKILHMTFAHIVLQSGFFHSYNALDDVSPPLWRILFMVHARFRSCYFHVCSPVLVVEVSVRSWWYLVFLWSRMYIRPYCDDTRIRIFQQQGLWDLVAQTCPLHTMTISTQRNTFSEILVSMDLITIALIWGSFEQTFGSIN